MTRICSCPLCRPPVMRHRTGIVRERDATLAGDVAAHRKAVVKLQRHGGVYGHARNNRARAVVRGVEVAGRRRKAPPEVADLTGLLGGRSDGSVRAEAPAPAPAHSGLQAGPITGGSLMVNYALRAGLLIVLATPALAQTSSTTTTTTGGASSTTTSEEYYVVRDPSTKRCTVTTSRPSGGTSVVVGNTVFHSRSEAESSVSKVCTD